VRNLTQKTHWRIKTHFGISHLDVNKITAIVSDMRKILAKHPHVEQQRLHRRVFFDNIEAENQALLILVSCFVKTPHFEEYLRVKEIILLDLLKVISHHNARLATPIRSVQRVLDENEPRGAPFRDGREAHHRPFLLVGAHAMEEDDDDDDDSDDISDLSADHIAKAIKGVPVENADVADGVVDHTTNDFPDSKDSKSRTKPNEEGLVGAEASGTSFGSPSVTTKPPLDGLDSLGLNPNDITLLGAALKEKPPAKIDDGPVEPPLEQQAEKRTSPDQSSVSSRATRTERVIGKSPDAAGTSTTKVGQEDVTVPMVSHSMPASSDGQSDPWKVTTASYKHDTERPQSVEENLVLGVALNAPKRTLPHDDELSNPSEQRELVTSQNGIGIKDQKDPSSSNASPEPVPLDARDRER